MTKLQPCAAACLLAASIGIQDAAAQRCRGYPSGRAVAGLRGDFGSRHSGYVVVPGCGGWVYYYYSPRDYSDSIWRHHGPGEGGYCYSPGVKRHHGLGDGYCRPPGSSTYWWTDGPPLHTPVAPPPEARRPPAPPPEADTSFVQTSRAWQSLAAGDARSARRDFAVLALRTPEDVNPKVGFAIASALLGEDDTAIFIMRKAFETDAVAVAGLRISEQLAARAQPLIRRFSDQASREDGFEAVFMSAALEFLAGSRAKALSLTRLAIEAGDAEPSTRALLDLLEEGPRQPAEEPDADPAADPEAPPSGPLQHA